MMPAETDKNLRRFDSEESGANGDRAWDIDDLIYDEFVTITVSDR